MDREDPVNILLVDDQPSNLLALEAILDELSENLIRAHSGVEALEVLQETEVALILMDVSMPDIDGLETARLIRQRDKTHHTPIIFLTGYDHNETELFHGYSLGAVDFLIKPIVSGILRAKVATFVELFRRIRRVQEQEARLRAQQQQEHQRAMAEEKQRWEMERLRERSRQQEVIVELGLQALSGGELTELLDGAARTVGLTLAVDSCVILELLADGTTLQTLNGMVWPAGWTGQATLPSEEGTQTGLSLLSEQPLVLEDIPNDPCFRGYPFPAGVNPSSGASVLIRGKDRPFGVLGVYSAGKRKFTPGEVRFLEAAANVLATAIMRKKDEDALRESSRRKDEFLAMLGHELRNPLTPIRNGLHILRRQDLSRDIIEQTRGMMERQTTHMTRLVDDLLDLSRITRGLIILKPEPVELAEVVLRVIETMNPLVREHQHELHVGSTGGPFQLEADPVRLEQIVTNLLSNAIKYTNPGGRITVLLERDGGEAVLRVRDNGIGIAPEMLPRIFDLFMQAERYLDRSQGGLGIGLTLVRSLVEHHRGSVAVTSAGLGQGCEFVVRLPLAPGVSPTAGAVAEPRKSTAKARRRVLIVDDNEDAARSLADLLRVQGHVVQTAYTGMTALQTARGFRPDVILLDIGLPDLNGYEVACRLRGQNYLTGTAIIALSGYAVSENNGSNLDGPFDLRLVKPVDLDHLYGLLAEELTLSADHLKSSDLQTAP
jgi:signal transduction histidine kinase/DNA-binding response OmpR family regulator